MSLSPSEDCEMTSLFERGLNSLKVEMQTTWDAIRSTRWSLGLFFAIFCVFFVIVGNVILLIAINFWIGAFPAKAAEHNSSQIAIQVVALIFLVLLFSTVGAIFTIVYGALPLWHILVDTDRVGCPLYRFFLLFCSGLTNGVSSLLGVYAMTYTPEFIQAVLLCAIPFSAQAWTVIFIPIERKRDYLSMFFIGSFVLFVAGVLLSSLSAFLHPSSDGEKASWAWALLYLASSVIFGLWCVVQRLYLDAVVRKETSSQEVAPLDGADRCSVKGSQAMHDKRQLSLQQQQQVREPVHDAEVNMLSENEPAREAREGSAPLEAESHSSTRNKNDFIGAKVDSSIEEEPRYSDGEDDEEAPLSADAELLMKREWASQTVDSNAAKVILLLIGLLFQLLVSFVLFPVDAIPWFGTSGSAQEAWDGFRNSVDFIFSSWVNVRFGLLYSLGYAMSFIGCTYLNEHSPTLASVVLQLAGPITSLVLIIIPQWNLYKSSNSVGQQVGGVILLLVAALLYHLWEQQSMRRLIAKTEEAQHRRQLQQQQHQQNRRNDELSENAVEPQ
jgi:MFS family permease